MNRLHALLIVVAIWAAIFLPGLGSTEIKGEEGRRILPAITMLETGNWLVPYVGGKAFLRKPPLVNWAIAAAFELGGRNEWMARLPSVLAILALAVVVVASASGGNSAGADAGLVAAVILLTQISTVEKGRMAEIEAIYTGLSGIGIALWLQWWTRPRSPWLVWTIPFVFLGAAMLAKGPLHLLFFYAIVLAVLWRAKAMREILHPAHFAGIAIMTAIFAAWYIPYRHDEATVKATEVWQAQMAGRLTGQFDWVGWITAIPRGLSDHLPWVIFAPLLWRKDLAAALPPREHAAFLGARRATVLCFFGLLLLPGILPRYTMPLVTPFSTLLGIALADSRLEPASKWLRGWWRTNTVVAVALIAAACAAPVAVAIGQRQNILNVRGAAMGDFAELLTWPLISSATAVALSLGVLVGRWKLARPAFIATASGALVAAAMFLYAGSAVPFMVRRENVRPVARAINRTVPPNESLVIYDPDYQPAIFYLRIPYTYAPSMEDIPAGATWVLAREEKRKKLLRGRPEYEVIGEYPEGKAPQLLLLQRRAAPPA